MQAEPRQNYDHQNEPDENIEWDTSGRFSDPKNNARKSRRYGSDSRLHGDASDFLQDKSSGLKSVANELARSLLAFFGRSPDMVFHNHPRLIPTLRHANRYGRSDQLTGDITRFVRISDGQEAAEGQGGNGDFLSARWNNGTDADKVRISDPRGQECVIKGIQRRQTVGTRVDKEILVRGPKDHQRAIDSGLKDSF